MILALVKAVMSASATQTTLTTLTTQSERDLVSGDFCSNRSSGQYNILKAEGSDAGIIFVAAREELSQFRSTPFCSRGFIQPHDKSCTAFRSVSPTSVNPFGSREFSTYIFCQWLFVYARTWICCKTLAKLKFSVNAWDREANFLYQNLSSRSNNDAFAHNHSRNASKQLFRFRFMPSQFETHGAAASRTHRPTDRAPCPPRTDNPNEYPEPSERQQKTALHSQEPRQKHQQTENAAEDPRNRHTNGRTETAPRIPTTDRAEMLTGCRSQPEP